MQRRAAAVYGAFFLVLALGSYGMIAAASAPSITVEDPDHRAADGEELTIGGTTYTVSASAGSATLTWTDPDTAYDATWEEGDQVSFQGTNYTVEIPDAAPPTTVELTEVRPLPDDVGTTELNGTEYAVLEGENDTRELVPLEEYLTELHGPAEVRSLEQGRTYDFRGNQSTLEAVENGSATLAWTAPGTKDQRAGEGDELELGGTTYVAHFPNPTTLVLDSDLEAYAAELETQDTYDERINGLWGVSILSGLSVLLLLGLSYLPSRY
ncbi:MAG: hypothetical protein U5J98_10515 [Halobacteriales archaeon]|nr:hypothetical protein [Halobacteriales archaeon]